VLPGIGRRRRGAAVPDLTSRLDVHLVNAVSLGICLGEIARAHRDVDGGGRLSAIGLAARKGRAMTSWYAVHTQVHAEAKALENLLRQGYRAYLPRCRTWISHARRRQLALRPLFPRYLFAAVDEPAKRWRPILSTFGVSDVVRAGDRPAQVPGEVVEAIQACEQEGAFDGLDPRERLRPGELVRVTAGAFGDMVGRLVELHDNDRVIVLLELLGRPVRAELAGNMIGAA
jgi:transcriptional antiterminator RfaH